MRKCRHVRTRKESKDPTLKIFIAFFFAYLFAKTLQNGQVS